MENMKDSELLDLLADLKAKNATISMETAYMESFYQKNPSLHSPSSPKDEDRKKRKQKVKDVLVLSIEQKCEMAVHELEAQKSELEVFKTEHAKNLDNTRAEMEELDISTTEKKKQMYDFKRELVYSKLGKIVAERILRYFEESLKARDTLLSKIRLKNSTLKAQKTKLGAQLRQKQEMGEVLHAIDFDQLKIENQQYLAKIEDRNTELLKLKMSASNISQSLNSFRNKLGALSNECGRLRTCIALKKESLVKIIAETTVAESERKKALKINQDLNQIAGDYSVPSVLSYVQLNARQQELQKKLKAWTRKTEIKLPCCT